VVGAKGFAGGVGVEEFLPLVATAPICPTPRGCVTRRSSTLQFSCSRVPRSGDLPVGADRPVDVFKACENTRGKRTFSRGQAWSHLAHPTRASQSCETHGIPRLADPTRP